MSFAPVHWQRIPANECRERHERHCQWVTRQSDLLSLELPWRELQGDCANPTPFATWEWATGWQRHVLVSPETSSPEPSGESSAPKWAVAVLWEQGRLIGLVPLHACKARTGPAALFTMIRPFGSQGRHVESLTEGPIALFRRGCEQAALRGLLQGMLEAPWPGRLRLASLNIHADSFEPGTSARRRTRWLWAASGRGFGATVFRRGIPGSESQVVCLPDTWEAYRARLSKSMRDNLSYYPRKLEKRGCRWQVRELTAPADIAAEVGTLVDFHRRRAACTRGPRHTDHLPFPAHRAFLEDALPALAQRRLARMYVADIDGKPAAVLPVLEQGSVATFYYSGYDPDKHEYSPLLLATAAGLRSAIERGIAFADFMPDPANWKSRWGTRPAKPVLRVHHVNLRVIGS